MNDKKILIIAGAALFISALAAGYFGPPAFREHRMAQMRKAFVAPAMPEEAFKPFAAQFAKVSSATEPQFLPDAPMLSAGGRAARISDFSGRPTLVNLWATWCGPCVVELPSLQKLAAHYDGRLNVIAVSIEDARPVSEIEDFLEKRQIGGFAAHVDQSGNFTKNLGIQGIPTSFLIGKDGRILYRFEGDADWTSESARVFFDAFLLQNK